MGGSLAFPTADQTSDTIARLLVERIICQHGAPKELSDRGPNLSALNVGHMQPDGCEEN